MIVLTDLSEVLIRGVYGTELIVEERYGKKVAKRYSERCKEINSIFCELLRGHISEDVYWNVFLQEGKWPFGAEELEGILSLNMANTIPGTLETYRRIICHPDTAEKGAINVIGRPEFWVVSDHIAERRVELEFLHPEIYRMTSRQIWSFERRKIKSDKGFFDELLSRYYLSSRDVIFIDDLGINIDSATSAGITAIQFKDAKQLEMNLSELGFVFADTVQEANERNFNTNQQHWRL